MTNAEIVAREMVKNGIPDTEYAHTFAVWKHLGYSVKKGEKAAFKTQIWKPSKRKVKNDDEQNDKDENVISGMYLVTAHFFTSSQVEPMEVK